MKLGRCLFLGSLLAVLVLATKEHAAAVLVGRAVTRVSTIQHCTTQYCPSKVNKVSTAYKTVRTTGKTDYTKTTSVKVLTVSDLKVTAFSKKTVKPTVTRTWDRVTVTTTILTSTVSTRTRVRTRTIVATTTTTLTGSITVTTTPATRTIPAPSGFVGVLDDPYNSSLPKKRDAIPEPAPAPEPEPAKSYPKVVYCTKTLKAVVTYYHFKTVASTTLKVPGKTVWATVTDLQYGSVVVNYTPTTTVRTTTTQTLLRVTGPWVTVTQWTQATAYRSTVTVAAPRPTYYAACGPRNQAPPPGKLMNTNNPTAYGVYESFFTNLKREFEFDGTPYECCAACHGMPASEGKCVGSMWTFLPWWGPPPCNDPDECPIVDPEYEARCTLYFEDPAGVCPYHPFDTWSVYNGQPKAVSNGPSCASWKKLRRTVT